MINKNKLALAKNTFFLYLLVFSTYFFSFISVPYQTRVLGPEFFGRIGFSLAFMTYFKLIIDFGFLLSATEEIAIHRGEPFKLSQITSAVTYSKLLFTLISALVVLPILISIPRFRNDMLLHILTFFASVTASLFPDFLYRGLETMKTITIRTVVIRAMFVVLIFIFLKRRDQYYMVPLFNFLGNFLALIYTYFHMKKLGVQIVRVRWEYVLRTIKKSSIYFYSRIASTLYTVTNTIIIGLIYPAGNSTLGLYTSVDRIINTGKQGFSPIADSLYPYMVKNKDFKLIKKVLSIIMPLVIVGSIVLAIYSEKVMIFVLGPEFVGAGLIFKLMLPILVITPMTYILGFPVLSPMGLAKHGNTSIIYASIFHITMTLALYIIKMLNVYTLIIITLISESIILLYRIIVIWRNKSIFTGDK